MWTEKRNVIGLISVRGAEGELHRGASVQNTSDVVLRFLTFIFLYITHRMWCSVPQLLFWWVCNRVKLRARRGFFFLGLFLVYSMTTV